MPIEPLQEHQVEPEALKACPAPAAKTHTEDTTEAFEVRRRLEAANGGQARK